MTKTINQVFKWNKTAKNVDLRSGNDVFLFLATLVAQDFTLSATAIAVTTAINMCMKGGGGEAS